MEDATAPDERSTSRVESVSVVIPVFNEAESLPHLHSLLIPCLEKLGRSWEVLYCDDGSTDGSFKVLDGFASDSRVRVISFRRNFGQTAALAAGFEHSTGDVVVAMDADLQNSPEDIGALLERIEEGYDVVSGWRHDRKDAFWTVTLPSRVGNAVIGHFTGVPLHDYGCTLTAYRREVIQEFRLYGEMHRFIPAWAASVGAKIDEIPVRHNARQWGESKYGLSKAWRVLLDLITVRFLVTYSTKPIYFFGRLGLRLMALASAFWGWTIAKKVIWQEPLYTDPFFFAGIFLALAGIQILLFGLLAELSMRTYYESQQKRIYVVRELRNLSESPLGDRR
ncbi:MAG: glycosyltransferase family 2 protein [Myxococcota bacterium]|nr:glycosyltransferase family 2 protein [Myxococcota bacterium]